MPDLIALDLAGGPAFVESLRRAWDDGDAILPIDQRLPQPAKERLLDLMRPRFVESGSGSTRTALPGALSVDEGDAVVVATSGTTGDPKGVVLTHDAVRASAEATSAYLEVDADTDRWLACIPLAHIGGLAVVMRALLLDVDLEVHPGFDADAVIDAAHRGASLVSLVPTAFQRLDPSIFRRILLGGSAIPADRPEHAIATYGLTETGSGVVYNGVPLDGVELRIDDGEVQLRGRALLRCYRNGTDPKDADGWLGTGDSGSLSDDGVLSVEGRRGDLIITGGENVWPEPVERLLETHPAVAEAAVVGRPHPEWGKEVTAVIVVAESAAPPSLDELRALVREHMGAFAAPRSIELVKTLPRTAIGKLQRNQV